MEMALKCKESQVNEKRVVELIYITLSILYNLYRHNDGDDDRIGL